MTALRSVILQAYDVKCGAVELHQVSGDTAKAEYKQLRAYEKLYADALQSNGYDINVSDDDDVDNAIFKEYNEDEKYSRKKLSANDFATNAMIWARSGGTQVGDARIIYDGYRDKWVAIEKTEDSLIELDSFEKYEDGTKFVEEWKNVRVDESVHSYIETVRSVDGNESGTLRNDAGEQGADIATVGMVGSQSESDRHASAEKGIGDSRAKYSYKRINSEGKAITDAQHDYFKDSKVVDENGNLLIVYHGTDALFTVFDVNKGRANMDIQMFKQIL